jgi:hypothetical protein
MSLHQERPVDPPLHAQSIPEFHPDILTSFIYWRVYLPEQRHEVFVRASNAQQFTNETIEEAWGKAFGAYEISRQGHLDWTRIAKAAAKAQLEELSRVEEKVVIREPSEDRGAVKYYTPVMKEEVKGFSKSLP